MVAIVSVEEFEIMIKSDVMDEAIDITREIFNGVVRRTPVRTGRARASWNVGVGVPDRSLAPIAGEPGNPQPSPKFPNLVLTKPTPIFIDNAIPYIQYLEHGSPTTSATGMVSATVSKYL